MIASVRDQTHTRQRQEGKDVAKSRVFKALGAMSGTSMDGVDVALIETDGETVFAFGKTSFRPYTAIERDALRAAMGKWEGPDVETAAEVVELAHAELLSEFPEAEIIGFHGQTTFHDPASGFTCQIGNGEVLAQTLERTVVWDFRSSDVALGGQGAPLAPFFHHALARHIGATGPIAFLNLGGVGNVTLVDPSKSSPETPGACVAFDTGPANAKLDDYARSHTNHAMDEGGMLALSGDVHDDILASMLRDGFFAKLPPKSLDRDDFADWLPAVEGLSAADALATLAAASAGAVSLGLDLLEPRPERLILCGGGRRNAALAQMIAGLAPCPVTQAEEEGLDGDMLEAQAFAFLAARVLRGLPTSAPGTTGVAAPVGGGCVSRPT